jgi:hypothetical protein
MSDPVNPVGAPRDRETAISVAYLRLLGHTQEDATKATGVSEKTIQRWESCTWWPEVQAEASRRWLSGLESRARQTLFDNLDGPLSLKVLERRLPELAPPVTQPQDHTGTITLRVVWDTPDADE